MDNPKKKGIPSKIDLAKHVPSDMAAKEIPSLRIGSKTIRRAALKSGGKVGASSVLALVLARSLSRKAEKNKKLQSLTKVLDAKDVKLASAHEGLDKEASIFAAGARVFGWGKNLLTRFGGRAVQGTDAALPHASTVFNSAGQGTSQALTNTNRLKNALQTAKNKVWQKGTGTKNVYRQLGSDGKPVLDAAGKEVQFLSGKGMFRAPKDWQKVKSWDTTGGWAQQLGKGVARHGTTGALGGYGLSWALNQDADWNDERRINMALGGAILHPSMRFSNKPAAIASTAAMMVPGSPVHDLMPKGFASGKSLWDRRHDKDGGERFSQIKALAGNLQQPHRAEHQRVKSSIKSMNERAKIQKRLNREGK